MKLLSRLKERKTEWCTAVVVAAGSASRMGGVDKVMVELEGIPMLIRSIQPFQASDSIQEIVVVTRLDLLETVAQLCKQYELDKVSTVVVGGETRTESVLCGLEAVGKQCSYVAIHDGARPFVSRRIIDETVACAKLNGAAAPAMPVKDTVKVAPDKVVIETPDRETLYAVQTPQCFDKDLIVGALTKARDEEAVLTDDCMAVERIGMKVHLTKGGNQNIKITTPADLWMADGILRGRANYCASDTDTTSTV
jgi:2-C-methyl-D-erythritol 4-phosphate cytidylyltransferase